MFKYKSIKYKGKRKTNNPAPLASNFFMIIIPREEYTMIINVEASFFSDSEVSKDFFDSE